MPWILWGYVAKFLLFLLNSFLYPWWLSVQKKVLGILQIKMQWMSWCICLSWMRGSQGEAVKPLGSSEFFTFCLFIPVIFYGFDPMVNHHHFFTTSWGICVYEFLVMSKWTPDDHFPYWMMSKGLQQGGGGWFAPTRKWRPGCWFNFLDVPLEVRFNGKDQWVISPTYKC